MDVLNLLHFNILNIAENEHDFQIIIEPKDMPLACPHCGSVANLYKHDNREQLYMDLPIHGKRVGLLVRRQRYRCRECNQTFWERLDHTMDDKRSATKRLVEFIEKHSLKRTFVSISEDVGMDEKTIRNIFRDYVNRLEKTLRFETPKWLGIDEIHLIKPRCVLTNVEKKTVLDVLPNRNKDTVVSYLSRLPHKDRIRYVTMDMWQPYKDAVYAVLPDATVIVDKFHVVHMANQTMETVRKHHREGLSAKERRTLMHDRFILLKRRSELNERQALILDTWLKNSEELATAYQLKESFYEIWNSKSKAQAIQQYEEWQVQVPDSMRYAFNDILTAVKNWHREIFAYFDHPITNAYTESLNNLIRAINRLGRGYSFEALRAKILFTEGVTKTKKPKYPKHDFAMERMVMHDMIASYVHEPFNDEEVNFGVPFSTLLKLLEDDE